MNRPFSAKIFLKSCLLIAFAVVVSQYANAQSKETEQSLQVTADEDIDTVGAQQCYVVGRHTLGSQLYLDFGGSSLMTKTSKTTTANGLSWAIGAQASYAVQARNMKMKTLFSAGLELRNFNATASSTDRFGGTAYDNMHYWYVGIPVNIQIISTRYNTGKKATTGYYAQVGFTTGFTTNVNDVYSMQGVSTTYDTTGHYKSYMLLPNIGAGFTCATPRATYTFGPYVSYTVNSLVPNTAITQRILSYGIRFSTLFF